METSGILDIILGLSDGSGKLLDTPETGGLTTNMDFPGLYKFDLRSAKGVTQANITGLAATAQKVYGSNAVAEQHVGAISPKVTFVANDMEHTVYDALVGLAKDQFGGYAQKNSEISQGPAIVHTANSDGTIDLYIGFPLGIFTPGELNIQTNTQNPALLHDSITFDAQARPTDSLLYEKFYSDSKDFDYKNMLAYITGTAATSGSSTTPQKLATDNISK